jgi:hypothetical protein
MAAARRPATQATEIARLQRENERLRMERDIFRFIEDRRADYPVTILCDVLGISLSVVRTRRGCAIMALIP